MHAHAPKKRSPATASEAVRRQAVSRVLSGESPEKVIRELGFHRSRIYAWLNAYEQEGALGLTSRKRGGRPAKLTPEIQQRLVNLLTDSSPQPRHMEQGHTAQGLWEISHITHLLKNEFKLQISKNTLTGLLTDLGLGYRTLHRKLAALNSPTIDTWLQKNYAPIQRWAQKGNAQPLLWLLESEPDNNLYKLMAQTPKGALYFRFYRNRPTNDQVADFLQCLHRAFDQKLFLYLGSEWLLDQTVIPGKTQHFLSQHAEDIILFTLPILPNEKPVGQQKKRYIMLEDMDYECPEKTDMEGWALLLSESLLDVEYPMSIFLAALVYCMGGAAIIASNLKSPAAFVRPLMPGKGLKDMILHNKNLADHWHDNPFITALKKPGDLYTLDEVLPASERKNNGYYAWQIRSGNQHIIALSFSGPDNTLCALLIHRQFGMKKFSREDREFLFRLRPHLENAMGIAVNHWRNTFTVNALEETTKSLEIAAVVLDGNKNVVQICGTTQGLLEQGNYFRLTSTAPDQNKQQLDFLSAKRQKQFDAAVQQAISWRQAPLGSKPMQAMRFTYNENEWLGVLVQPISPPSLSVPHSVAVSPHAVVYITESGKARLHPRQQIIVQLFNLSSREAHLTTLLTDGLNLTQAAASMNITPATARTYLQHIYEKVGVNRQQELVQRVMKSVALLV